MKTLLIVITILTTIAMHRPTIRNDISTHRS